MKTIPRPPGRIRKKFKKSKLAPTPTQQIVIDRIKDAESNPRNLVVGVPLEDQ